MTNKNKYWDVELTPEEKKDLDLDTMEELNERYSEDNLEKGDLRKNRLFKFVTIITSLVFILLILNNFLDVVQIQVPDFISKSSKLSSEERIQEFQKAVVEIKASDRTGTGFNVNSHGLIITNQHIVQDAEIIYVKFSDRSVYASTDIINYPALDLALVKIEGSNLPKLEINTSPQITENDPVLIIGNPLGFSRLVNDGKIAGIVRLKDWEKPVLKINTTIYKGNSGSPVINQAGEVIAVVFATLKLERQKDEELIGLAVPLSYIKEHLTDLE